MSGMSKLALMQPPLLSKQSGCVAAWHAGGLPGPSLSGTSIRDFISNTHHAVPVDATNPLKLAPEGGLWYVYFPGSSGNSLTITLDDSTAYDYTIVYSDASTDTDGQTSTGAGLLTFGGTDAKFAGLKVRRILIVPDGGGATVADIVLTDPDAYNATRTSLVARSGHTVTINRSATGRKTSVVDRPILLLGTDDFMAVPDHPDLDFLASGGMTLALAYRAFGTPSATEAMVAKKATISSAGYAIYRTSAGNIVGRVTDGSGGDDFPLAALAESGPRVVTLRRPPGRVASIWRDGVKVADGASVTGDLSTATALRFGVFVGGASFAHYEWLGAALFRRALSNDEVARLNREMLGSPA